MSSNYKTHQEFELRANLENKRQSVIDANRLENEWKSAMQERQECECKLTSLHAIEAVKKEEFRDAHRCVTILSQIIGERQDEMFLSCEDEEDWLH